MFFSAKCHKNLIIISFFIILNACQLQEPTKNHGILYLKNRAEKLSISQSNMNDVLRIVGNPHSKSISNKNEWIYIERVLTKGKFFKLGKNVLKKNDILVLSFDKYGILKEINFYDKNSKNKIAFSTNTTENNVSQKSFVEKFLQSIKTKMYKK